MIGSLIEQCLRRERASILASLYRFCHDLSLAEEAVQEASLQAMRTWPTSGPPERPGAWLTVVARRKLVDLLRARARDARTQGSLADATPLDDEPIPVAGSSQDCEDRLRLLFACCAANIPVRARIALALRSILGLSTREIARALLEREVATAKRIVRAKAALTSPREMPAGEARAHAIELVLQTLYLVFNEGYLAAEGDSLVRHRLVDDAIELAETVVELLPWHADAQGLLALMLLHASRRDARIDANGALVTLEHQDRSRWNRSQITRGTAVLDRAMSLLAGGVGVGVFQVQAAIAALHCNAARAEDTDWVQIGALYRLLLTLQPSPVVELNAAVAMMMTHNLRDALAWVNALERRDVLGDYHLLAAVKAELLKRLGHTRQANRYYRRARKLTANQHEKAFLSARIAATDEGG